MKIADLYVRVSTDENSFSRLDELFLSAEVKKQRHMVCSLFPDKLEYDGERFRTHRPNAKAELILLVNNELSGNKKGKDRPFSNLSLMVAPRGTEPLF